MTKIHFNQKLTFIILLMMTICIFNVSAYALPLATEDTKASNPTKQIADPYNRQSPFGSSQGILTGIQKQDIHLLSLYLEPSFVEKYLIEEEQQKLFLSNLSTLINQNTKLDASTEISRLTTGKLDDGLPQDMEKIGVLNIKDNAEKNNPDVLLKQIDNNGQPIWVLPSPFLEKLTSYSHNVKPNFIDEKTPVLLQHSLFGYSMGHLFASIVILVLTIAIGAFFAITLQTIIRVVFHQYRQVFLSLEVTLMPLTVICATLIYGSLLDFFAVNWLTRELVLPIVNIFKILTIAWLIYRIIKVTSENISQKVLENPKSISKSMVFLLTGIAKAGLIFLTILFLLNNFKVDISSGVALLGLGGLAFALGSQKVIENLIGSVVVVADKPIDIGDLCRFGTVLGTVESIGIRSTRIRTLERTLVTIPNGIFSSVEIENFNKRDKFLFYHLFAFALTADKSQIKSLLVSMRELLDSFQGEFDETHNKQNIQTSDNRVCLRYTERDCIKIEVRSYVIAVDFEVFLEQQEIMLLELMSVIENSGVERVKSSTVLSVGE